MSSYKLILNVPALDLNFVLNYLIYIAFILKKLLKLIWEEKNKVLIYTKILTY